MKLSSTQKRKPFITKRVAILITLLILVLGALAGLVYWKFYSAQSQDSGTRPMNTVDYNPPTDQEKDDSAAKKEEVIKNNDAKKDNNAPVTSSDMSVTITRASQAGAGQALNIRTIVHGIASGECVAELKKDGQPTVTKTFQIIADVSYATCKDADISAADFGASGEWQLNVTAKNAQAQSPVATTKVTITK